MIDNDRLNHSLAIARKMVEIGKEYNLNDDELQEDINSEYTSLFLKILNKADMQIDKYGNEVGYTKRLEDIKNRYGKNSVTYKNAEMLVSELRRNNH